MNALKLQHIFFKPKIKYTLIYILTYFLTLLDFQSRKIWEEQLWKTIAGINRPKPVIQIKLVCLIKYYYAINSLVSFFNLNVDLQFFVNTEFTREKLRKCSRPVAIKNCVP